MAALNPGAARSRIIFEQWRAGRFRAFALACHRRGERDVAAEAIVCARERLAVASAMRQVHFKS